MCLVCDGGVRFCFICVCKYTFFFYSPNNFFNEGENDVEGNKRRTQG